MKKLRSVKSIAFGMLAFATLGLLTILVDRHRNRPDALVDRDRQLIFDGRLTGDILSAGEAVLAVEYAHVIDNGEGRWPPHGPYGSIHVVVYDPEQQLEAPWSPELELYETMLYGPHRTVGDLYEWLDDEALAYTNYALYDWEQHGLDQVVLRFYESDPGLGREHDDLLAARVSREETEGTTVTLRSAAMEIELATGEIK